MIVGVIRYMRAIFLFLVVAILNAHMIIPHDHHQSDSDLCQENKYPFSKDGRTHHPSFPVHCHAFNDLASEKAVIYSLLKYNKCPDFIPGSVLIPSVSKLQFSSEKVFSLFIFPANSGIKELSSLRAPPYLS